MLDCSFGMKKWTNKFYRDFEGQAKIGCSSLWELGAGSQVGAWNGEIEFVMRQGEIKDSYMF